MIAFLQTGNSRSDRHHHGAQPSSPYLRAHGVKTARIPRAKCELNQAERDLPPLARSQVLNAGLQTHAVLKSAIDGERMVGNRTQG